MCIYFGNGSELTYETQEHVIPAALGCCTKLEKGVVSDGANKYFSPIERDVLEHSFIQIPRIIKGPGKRGKLSTKYATTSEVSVIEHDGFKCLGYMKGTEGYILSQFIIDNTNKISFMWQQDTDNNAQAEIQKLKSHISEMGEKYVPVNIDGDDSGSVFVTYFKDKIHIGYTGELSEIKVNEIKKLFSGSLNTGNSSSVYGQIRASLEITEDFVKLGKVIAKTAINTLAYIIDAKYIMDSPDFNELIEMTLSDDDKILTKVNSIKDALAMKQHLHLSEEQHSCLITRNGKELRALVFFYERCFEVILCKNLSKPFLFPIEGVVCDWKNRKDYRYLDYLTKIGVLTKNQ
ncbi:hypothetical protein [Clostridium tyrobutyricum]|uniref:hypothetical protein n=1 Tax=Clostridium tyrobutyricum TaxID=1519 RepID=UPI00241D0670|nr:hypothetical protein [Clostridium tyrobutyricum]